MQWALLAVIAVGVTAASAVSSSNGTVLLGAVAVLALLFAARAARHNARVYPNLRTLWERSHMCARCGEVFAAADDQS